jgi:hypothetical protein
MQLIESAEQRVTLDLSGADVKHVLLCLGRDIRKRSRSLEKRKREGREYVPEPGHVNVEALFLARAQEVDTSIRAQVEFEGDTQRVLDHQARGEKTPRKGREVEDAGTD